MSAITVDNELVHYEVLGRGRPVILVHGWLGSWRYWIPAMQQISVKYRTYAIDLWGFGESGKEPGRYTFNAQVRLLGAFMERMGIAKAALVGHGLGAAVVTRYTLRHPESVPRLMTIAPPLFRLPESDTPAPAPVEGALADAIASPEQATAQAVAAQRDAFDTEAETIPLRTEEIKARLRAALEREARQLAARQAGADTEPIQSPAEEPAPLPNPLKERWETLDPIALLERHVDAGDDLNKLKVEVRKADPHAFAQMVETLAGVDTLRELKRLRPPVLAVYGGADTLLPVPDESILDELRANSAAFHAIEMPGLRHFPMLEDTAGFNRLLLDFLEAPDVTKISIKARWERRVR